MDDPTSYSGDGEAIDSFFGLVRRGERWDKGNLVKLLPVSLLPVLMYRVCGKPVFVPAPESWRELLRAYMQADLVVSKPGGFLYSSGRGLSLLISIHTLALALLADKPLYLMPQSIGPLSCSGEQFLLKRVLKRARLVMAREPASFRLLKSWHLPPDALILLPDLAFSYPGAPASSAMDWLREHGIEPESASPLLGMTVINWEAQNPEFARQTRYEEACAAAARLFIETYGGKVILFPQVRGPSQSHDDRVPARRIGYQLSDVESSVFLIEEPVAPDLLKALYGRMSLFVGTRMHSSIFALSQRVPVVAIGYQPKTVGILQMLGLDRWNLDIDRVTEKRLTQLLTELWEARGAVRDHLDRMIPTLEQQTREVGARVAADFRVKEGDSEPT